MVLAPAKINLFLEMVGKREDGYHLLQSLMVPLAFGDELEITPSDTLTLKVIGSTLAHEPPENNLVVKAARSLSTSHGANIKLYKRIPHAAGLGGGSSNAATTLFALSKLWKIEKDLLPIATSLGADVPFFLKNTPQYAEGIGEILTPVTLPKLYILLVKPDVAVPTADVFKKGFKQFSKAAHTPPSFGDIHALIDYLKHLKNDLTENAISIAPHIADILKRLGKTDGCLLARMSGSGATCFGIFDNAESCHKTAQHFSDHWVQATHTL
jgi:4-diphosphocytidyl-2-C-methyl-D-erythritol kinase